METTDQNMHSEPPEDMGPLLMHDPDDEDESHSLSSSDQHTLLSDVHLPDGATFITTHEDKGHQLYTDHDVNVEKDENSDMKQALATTGDGGEGSSQEAPTFKFSDGQAVTLEDGSTAYVLSSYKVGTQPIIFEDGTTMYISHEPPGAKFEHSIDNSSLNILHDLTPIGEPEEKRLAATASMSSNDHKLFKCEIEGCSKVYTTHHHLQYHKRSHMERKPFVCGYSGCDKTFSTSYGLKSHIRVHTGEKPYKCPHHACEKAFKTSGDLMKHFRIHTGEKPFRCPFQGCDRAFTTSNIRKVHIRTHTGEKPYSCDDCGKRFSSATNHRNHVRIHTGERPYACSFDGCNKRFTEYSSLYKHQVVHSSDKPYTCLQCGKLYRQASTLAMHKRTVHGEGDLMVTEADIMAGQLIALDQTKGAVLSTEVVGMITPQNKQYSGSNMVTTNQQLLTGDAASSGKPDSQQLHFTHLNPHNVVIVTDSSCFKVMQRQDIPSAEGVGSAQLIDSQCLIASPDKPGTVPSSTHEIIAQSIDLSATATDLTTS